VAVFPHDWISPSAECDHPPARPGGTRRVPPPLRRSRPTGAHAHRTARASYRPEPPDVVKIVTGYGTWLSDAAAPKLLIAAEPGILIVGRSLEFSLVASRTRPRSRSPAATSSRRIRLTRSGGDCRLVRADLTCAFTARHKAARCRARAQPRSRIAPDRMSATASLRLRSVDPSSSA
jgi:hypothetical protein